MKEDREKSTEFLLWVHPREFLLEHSRWERERERVLWVKNIVSTCTSAVHPACVNSCLDHEASLRLRCVQPACVHGRSRGGTTMRSHFFPCGTGTGGVGPEKRSRRAQPKKKKLRESMALSAPALRPASSRPPSFFFFFFPLFSFFPLFPFSVQARPPTGRRKKMMMELTNKQGLV